jgi:hypothetical protein
VSLSVRQTVNSQVRIQVTKVVAGPLAGIKLLDQLAQVLAVEPKVVVPPDLFTLSVFNWQRYEPFAVKD